MVVFDRQFNYPMAVSLISLHIAAFLGVLYWWYFGFYIVSWILAILLTMGRGLGISIGYHRMLTHRSFMCKNRVVRRVFVILGGLVQNARSWVSNHWSHHAYTDTEKDPHSPYWPYPGGFGGFLWSHILWLFWKFKPHEHLLRHPDLKDPDIVWEHKWHVLIMVLGFVVPFVLGGVYRLITFGWGAFLHGGVDSLLAAAVSMGVVLHVTCLINSLGHMVGWRTRKKGDKLFEADSSRNNPLLAIISFGEGNHGDHHKYPGSARLGWLDPSWLVIVFFEKMGIFHNVSRPPRST